MKKRTQESQDLMTVWDAYIWMVFGILRSNQLDFSISLSSLGGFDLICSVIFKNRENHKHTIIKKFKTVNAYKIIKYCDTSASKHSE